MPPARRNEQNNEYTGDVFVNPYTFVPFIEPGEAFRGEPAGHEALTAGRYIGEVTVRLTAKAPILLRGITRETADSFPRRDGVPCIPGSSLAGVVRSLHELIAGGCLRVFDHEFTPGYRDIASSRDGSWRLVRVAEVDESGRPTALTVCDEAVWVPARVLATVLGGAHTVVTGARVDVTGSETKEFGKNRGQTVVRREATRGPGAPDPQVTPGDGSVILVTDSGARHPTRDNGHLKYKSFYCATGRLTGRTATVTERAWHDFKISIADTDDMRRARADRTLLPNAPVTKLVEHRYDAHGPKPVGHRHEARPKLFPGQVLWARLDRAGTTATELALSAIWRHPGDHPAGKRVPAALLPCREADDLCPTCRIFGSADVLGGDMEARQRSYRGHVRFSDALADGEVTTRSFNLPPLGSPRPGAGQFYLTSPQSKAVPSRPLREWGSPAADKADRPRRLNGRKQYWLTGRAGERPFFRVDGEFTGTMASKGEAVQTGASFTFTVRFDGLTEAEIGGLLAALNPRKVLGRGNFGIAVGGGQPLGFGACVTEIVGMTVQDARSRYVGGSPPTLNEDTAVEGFRETVAKEVHDQWGLVGKALRLDHVHPADVWYPPKAEIKEGRLTPADLEPGFEFWTQSRGLAHDNRDPDLLRQLPKLEEKNQELPVRTRRDRGKRW